MKKLLMGNDAVAEGAVKAGCKFYAGYPITPASEVMHKMSSICENFVHAEDEIASANMVVGAALAGVKSMTATSGPGFSLMQEAIGLAFMIEAPCVFVDVQRVGPSTGMPTLPSQGDILQAYHGTHGEYFPVVFYPNSVEECYKYTIEAFNASEEASTPVILMSDGFLGHMYEGVDVDSIKFDIKDRKSKPLGSGNRHFTGLISKDNVPATKDKAAFLEWFEKVKSKIEKVSKNYNFYEHLENKDSKTLIIAYGITSRVLMPLKDKYAIFRPIRIFPVLEKELKDVAKDYDNIVVVEMNSGQYASEVERVLGKEVKKVNILGGYITLKDVEEGLKDAGL